MKKKDLLNNPLPSYIYFVSLKLYVNFEGQKKTYSYCEELGHLFKECPEREKQKANASWGTTSWGTGFRQNQHQPNDEEVYQTSFPPLQEPHDDTKKDPLVQQSTPMNKSSRLQPVRMDFFDGKVTFQNGVTITHKNNDPTHEKMILEKYGIQKEPTPTTSRESESSSSSEKEDQQDTSHNVPATPKKVRKSKRNRSKDSSIQAGDPPERKLKENPEEEERLREQDDEEVFHHHDESLASFECVCGEPLARPERLSPTFCPQCPIVLYKCHCESDNVKKTHKLRQGHCSKCSYKYVPDALPMNCTAPN